MNINEDKVPSTFDEAVQQMRDALSPDDITYIRSNPSELHHFTVGRFMRNTWSMWGDTPLKRDFMTRTGLFGHGDDLSGAIMEAVLSNVLGRSFNLSDHAKTYRKHVAKRGRAARVVK